MKKALTKTADFIQGSPLLEFAVGFILVLVLIWGGYGVYTVGSDIYIKSRPYTDYFDYQSVEFVEVDRSGDTPSLVFASTRIVKATYPIIWNDVLFCDNGKQYRFYSNQESESQAPKVATEYRTVEWNYQKPFPMGRTCYLESQVTMTVQGHPKKQVIKSDSFVVE